MSAAECWNIPGRDEAYDEFSEGSDEYAVDCSEPHTIELVEVGKFLAEPLISPDQARELLSKKFAKLTDKEIEQGNSFVRALGGPCLVAMHPAVGMPIAAANDGSVVAYPRWNGYGCSLRTPSTEQWAAGERWIQYVVYRGAPGEIGFWDSNTFQEYPGGRYFDGTVAVLDDAWLAEESCWDATDEEYVLCSKADPTHSVYKEIASRIWIPDAGWDGDAFPAEEFCEDLNRAFGATEEPGSGYGSASSASLVGFSVDCGVAIQDFRPLSLGAYQEQLELFALKPVPTG